MAQRLIFSFFIQPKEKIEENIVNTLNKLNK